MPIDIYVPPKGGKRLQTLEQSVIKKTKIIDMGKEFLVREIWQTKYQGVLVVSKYFNGECDGISTAGLREAWVRHMLRDQPFMSRFVFAEASILADDGGRRSQLAVVSEYSLHPPTTCILETALKNSLHVFSPHDMRDVWAPKMLHALSVFDEYNLVSRSVYPMDWDIDVSKKQLFMKHITKLRNVIPYDIVTTDNSGYGNTPITITLTETENCFPSSSSALFVPPEYEDKVRSGERFFSQSIKGDIWMLGITFLLMALDVSYETAIGQGILFRNPKQAGRFSEWPRLFPTFAREKRLRVLFKDLLARMLDPDPERRITLREIRDHPFFERSVNRPMPPLVSDPPMIPPHYIYDLVFTTMSEEIREILVASMVKLTRESKKFVLKTTTTQKLDGSDILLRSIHLDERIATAQKYSKHTLEIAVVLMDMILSYSDDIRHFKMGEKGEEEDTLGTERLIETQIVCMMLASKWFENGNMTLLDASEYIFKDQDGENVEAMRKVEVDIFNVLFDPKFDTRLCPWKTSFARLMSNIAGETKETRESILTSNQHVALVLLHQYMLFDVDLTWFQHAENRFDIGDILYRYVMNKGTAASVVSHGRDLNDEGVGNSRRLGGVKEELVPFGIPSSARDTALVKWKHMMERERQKLHYVDVQMKSMAEIHDVSYAVPPYEKKTE